MKNMKFPGWQIDLRMNAYLFGCVLLLGFWLLIRLFALGLTKQRWMLREFWWASFTCAALGFTEPLFVPSYWTPPSILRVWRWDFESFPFCFAVGGIAAVLCELPGIKGFLLDFYYNLERILRWLLMLVSTITGGRLHAAMLERPSVSILIPRDQLRIENMLLITFALAVFGVTGQFAINIIYKSAIVCLSSAAWIVWRRPSLRWQLLGGAISFTLLYTIVLVVTPLRYPDFFNYWNLQALSGIRILGAPAEEYLYAFTFGAFWAPLYEAWKQTRIMEEPE
ncbi:MAG TPA: lycopene cyclase domain-containing protein [Candidatus Dormibacteraeota bacterium]|nr:lycopene cyclase domain-containing protein [Candidatus Dormibacteraeota bacterium]